MEVANGKSDDFQFFDEQMIEKMEKNKITSNKKFEEDMKYAVELNRFIANTIGIWPVFSTKNKSIEVHIQILKKRLKNIGVYFLLGFLLVPGMLNILLEDRTSKGKLFKSASMILTFMGVIKYTIILLREEKVRACLGLVESGWKQAGSEALRSLMRRHADMGRKLTRSTVVTFYMAGVCYRLMRVLLTPNRIGPDGSIHRPFSSPIYSGIFRFNASASPVYEAIFVVQLFGAFTIYSITITCCSYAAVFATHACGQLDVVMHLLHQLVDSADVGSRLTQRYEFLVGRKLKIIIQLHLKILRFIGEVEDLLHESSLVDIVGATWIFCLVGYYIIMDMGSNTTFNIVTYTVMISAQLATMFTYCYVGQIVTDQTEKVAVSSYMINWYDLPPKKELYIGLIIAISHTPFKLTAGKMFELSMYNFGNVVKTGFGYMNLLRTMNI